MKWVLSMIYKVLSQPCQLCLYLKDAKLVQKYPQLCQLCQLCLGSELFQLMRKNVTQLWQVCIDLNDAKLVQK